ncbi:MAG: GAF domain-containing sensor histidine kinase [Candidatus Daviesbacteria bacterium]
MVGTIYYFSYAFPDNKQPPRLGLVVYILIGIPTALSLIFTDYFVVDVVNTITGPETKLGPVYPVVSVLWATYAALSFLKMIQKYRISTGRFKLQLRYMLIGLGLFTVDAVILDGLFPIFLHTSAYFSLSAAFSLFFVILTSYSIVKHRLMDFRLALQELIVFTIVTVIVSAIFLGSALAYWKLTNTQIKTGVFFIIFFISTITTLIFERVYKYARIFAGKYLFQSVYDYQQTLRNLSISLSSYLDMPKLIDIITNVVMQTMRLSRIAILVRDFSDNHYKIQRTVGFNEENGISLVKDNFLTSYLEVHPQIIVLEEIRTLISEANIEIEKDRLQQLYDHMEHIEAALIVPVVNANKVIGMVVLGNKISGDPYTVQDIDLLNTIASQASIAIENARLYKEVYDLNQNLQGKINEATAQLQQKNDALERAYQELKILDKLKDDFVSVVSHELRTPMTAIRSYAWMALNRPDITLSEKMKKYLSRTLLSTERLINLVNDTLNVSRLEAGRVEIKPIAFDIQVLVKDSLSDVEPKAKERNITLTVVPGQVPSVFADPGKVREVVINLVSNSIKFTPSEGQITISFFSDGKTVDISIKDTGVGIAQEDLSRLFQKFTRLNNSYVAAATSGGTGLGLYISKSLVELMGGKISVTSEGLGKGSTFTFSLLAAIPEVLSQSQKYTNIPAEEAKPLEPVAI